MGSMSCCQLEVPRTVARCKAEAELSTCEPEFEAAGAESELAVVGLVVLSDARIPGGRRARVRLVLLCVLAAVARAAGLLLRLSMMILRSVGAFGKVPKNCKHAATEPESACMCTC